MSEYGHMGLCRLHGTPEKPQRCMDFPEGPEDMAERRPSCTYRFINEQREGTCQPNVCQAQCCCAEPREGGEPDAPSLSALQGGLPCKFLEWKTVPPPVQPQIEKHASHPLSLLNLWRRFRV